MNLNQREQVKVVRRKTASNTTLSDTKDVRTIRRQKPVTFSMSDELAGSQFYYKNFLVKDLKDKFFDNAQLWHVEKCYPYCEKGMLHVDEPTSVQEIELCVLKSKLMKEKKLKYIYITREMDLIDCLKELGESL